MHIHSMLIAAAVTWIAVVAGNFLYEWLRINGKAPNWERAFEHSYFQTLAIAYFIFNLTLFWR
jgi:hypothetical protein